MQVITYRQHESGSRRQLVTSAHYQRLGDEMCSSAPSFFLQFKTQADGVTPTFGVGLPNSNLARLNISKISQTHFQYERKFRELYGDDLI